VVRTDYLLLAVGVAAIITVIIAGALREESQVPITPETNCPELEPLPQITPERAVVVMAASYINIGLWEFFPSSLLKWCQVIGNGGLAITQMARPTSVQPAIAT